MDPVLKTVRIADITENPNALRGVAKTAEEFAGLVDSIKARGVLQPVLLREIGPNSSSEMQYGLIDGLQRFTASKDAGRDTIPAQVIQASDAEVLEAQILTNLHRIETKPAEYTKQLYRILSGNPLMTISDLATTLSKSPTWVSERLSLSKLHEKLQKLVDEDAIPLANAYPLAKLPVEEQLDWTERAQTMKTDEFAPAVRARVKELSDAKRAGKGTVAPTFVPVPFLQKIADIKDMVENTTKIQALLAAGTASTLGEAVTLALQWVLHLDPLSVDAGRAKFEADLKKREEEKAARKAEREAKKAADAAAAGETIRAEAEAVADVTV